MFLFIFIWVHTFSYLLVITSPASKDFMSFGNHILFYLFIDFDCYIFLDMFFNLFLWVCVCVGPDLILTLKTPESV